MHVDMLIVAVDAVLAGSPDVYAKLQAAAEHMPTTAIALTGAITTQFPDLFDGDPASPASELRSALTYLLQEHLHLARLPLNHALADGGHLEAPAHPHALPHLHPHLVTPAHAPPP